MPSRYSWMTVTSRLREHGYATTMVGRCDPGFDSFLQNRWVRWTIPGRCRKDRLTGIRLILWYARFTRPAALVLFLPSLLAADGTFVQRPPSIQGRFTICDGDWKLILPKQRRKSMPAAVVEVYNLNTDCGEQTNAISQNPRVAEQIRRQ